MKLIKRMTIFVLMISFLISSNIQVRANGNEHGDDGELKVSKTAVTQSTPDAPKKDTWLINEVVTYRIKVENKVGRTLTNVIVTDENLGNEQVVIGDMQVGAVEYAYFTTSYSSSGDYKNKVVIAGSYEDKNGRQREISKEAKEEVKVINPDFEIIKTAVTSEGDPTLQEVWNQYDRVTYQFELINKGDMDLKEIRVVDPMLDLDRIYELDKNDNITFYETYDLLEEDVGGITNNVTATATNIKGLSKDIIRSDDSTIMVKFARITIEKLAVISEETPNMKDVWYLDEVVTYQFRIRNEGNIDFPSVLFQDNDLNITSRDIGPMNAGMPVVVFYETTSYDEVGYKINIASVTAYSQEFGLENEQIEPETWNSSREVIYVSDEPKMMVTKTAVVSEANPIEKTNWYVGETVTYKIDIENIGEVIFCGLGWLDEDLDMDGNFDGHLNPLESLDPIFVTTSYGAIGTYENTVVVTVEDFHYPITQSEDVARTSEIIISDDELDYPDLSVLDEEMAWSSTEEVTVSNRPVITTTTPTLTTNPTIYNLTVQVVGDGNVPGFVGTNSFTAGTNVNLNAVLGTTPGIEFIGWSGDATGITTDLLVVMTGDKTVVATFGPVVETPVIPVTPIPPVEPEVVIEPEVIPEAAPEALPVLDVTEIPEEALPQTGGLPLEVLMLFGTAFIGVGKILRKKDQ